MRWRERFDSIRLLEELPEKDEFTGTLERESILGEESIEMSRFSKDSTDQVFSIKRIIPGGLIGLPSSTSSLNLILP
ncbi:hypothetical protein Tco_0755143 [Tanacetum coccineum]